VKGFPETRERDCDDPSARHVGTEEAQGPNRQAGLGPDDRRRDPRWHRGDGQGRLEMSASIPV